MKHINRGSNQIFRRAFKLKENDEDPPVALLIADLVLIQLELSQKGELKKTYVYTGSWPTGLSAYNTSTVELQLDSALSESLQEGKLDARWIVKFPNDDFDVDSGNQTSTYEETIAYVH